MRYTQLGQTDIMVSVLGFGCMGMSEWYGATDDKQSKNTILNALDKGINFFDTADIYGKGHNETLLGKTLQPHRDQVVIGTKCGIVRDSTSTEQRVIDCSREYITQSCDASLKRLGIDHIDIFYLHRIDASRPIEESILAMADLVKAGKIRAIGLSEANPEIIERAHHIFPVSAIQTEYSIAICKPAKTVLPLCKDKKISFVAYSPLSRGLLSNQYKNLDKFDKNDFRRELPYLSPENFNDNQHLFNALENIANNNNITPAQLALAWVINQNDNIIAIPGMRRTEHLLQNVVSTEIKLSHNCLAEIEKVKQEFGFKGERLPVELLALYNMR
ncbi:MAG: aldo/keto reductase [Legionellales bacterium]|nr:aldo/keto reductase [Legionellales bacterium]